ncbi:MAG TPA: COR domain-containing protein [Tenuifilaceae bacterium]|nr:COR domain-containing protein [Tenuifilaceae bacterium]
MIDKVRKRLDNVKLYGWQVLDLKNCGLKEFPVEIFEYPDIRTIDLSNDSYCDDNMKNKIKDIPKEISKLKNLIKLNLSDNKINSIPESITDLKKLRYLDVSYNNLTHLSEKIANMQSLQILNLENNPFDFLPPEIVARGIESIRNFIKELSVKDFLFEVKLILVGEGRVGKTCIANALIDDNYQLDAMDSTEGINIDRWIIPKAEISIINSHITRDFQINIWDFGGQEIYHSTHQFFLTKRSIYLLVTESRKEDRYDDFYYWLNIIKLLGDKSPVIMVLNKCDQPTKELPIKDFKDIFSNIVDFVKISLKNDYRDTFNSFKSKLIERASNLPHIGNPLPKVWVDIRREIENMKLDGINYITEKEYLDICKKHYRSEESALFLSEYFHDLGVILHFKEDIELKDIVFLNHEWITKGVYSILDDRKIISQKGRFDNDDLKRIWNSGDYKFKMRELLALMKNRKFDLCFEMKNGEYLVPRLLPVDEIEHTWDSSPSNLKFELRYKFMPKGILARLIVKLCNDIFEDKYWRYGVILKYESTKAIIKEKYFENKITIEISGNYKREYLFNIRKTINEIHKDFNRIEVNEMVPCNCSHCSCVENPTFYKYDLLKRYELKDIKFIRCSLSLEEVNVFELTSDVISGQLSKDKVVFCENKNAEILKGIGLDNIIFCPERDSASVFIHAKTTLDRFGLRDRDFLTDSEILKIKSKYPNYYILEYYCFENYLYHPDNIEELKIQDFNKNAYIQEIVRQKNANKNQIISNYKMARKSYQEFKIESENLKIKKDENEIIKYLESDDIEIFFKSFSMKDYFNKDIISKYNLQPQELSKTKWFKSKMKIILDLTK